MRRLLFKKNKLFSIHICDWTTVHSVAARACGHSGNLLLEHSRKHTTTVWEEAAERTPLSHSWYLLTPTRPELKFRLVSHWLLVSGSTVCEGFPNSWWLPGLLNICAAGIPWPLFISFYLCQMKNESDQIADHGVQFPLPLFHRLQFLLATHMAPRILGLGARRDCSLEIRKRSWSLQVHCLWITSLKHLPQTPIKKKLSAIERKGKKRKGGLKLVSKASVDLWGLVWTHMCVHRYVHVFSQDFIYCYLLISKKVSFFYTVNSFSMH